MKLASLLLLLCGALSAQVAVSGRVLGPDNQPVEGVNITSVSPRSTLSATTNPQGEFALEAPPGFLALRAVKAGYIAPPIPPVTLEAGKPVTGLVVKLALASSIGGRITGPDGNPIPSAQVTAFRYEYTRGRRQLSAAGYTVGANAAGEYKLDRLPQGRYYVRVEPKAPLVATYYPQVTDMFGAAPIDIATGEQRQGVDIRQRSEPTYSIRGKAVDGAGDPVMNAGVVLISPREPETLNPPMQTPTKADGSFEFANLQAGSYIVRAIPSGNLRVDGQMVPSRYSGRAEVQLGREDRNDVRLRVDTGFTVTGKVRMGNDEPLPPAPPAPPAPAGFVAESGPRVTMMEAEQLFTFGRLSGAVGADGTFRIEGVSPSRYYLPIQGFAPDLFIQTIRVGSLDITRAPLDLTNGPPGPIEIVLSNKPATAAAVVRDRDGKAAANAAVALWPEVPDLGNAASGVRTAHSDASGVVRFATLRPGKYGMVAFSAVEQAFLASPDFLDRFRAKAAALDLGEGATQQVSLEAVAKEDAEAAIRMLP